MKDGEASICGGCVLRTDRLIAGEWHAASEDLCNGRSLEEIVAEILTEPVTRSLPPSWHGDYSIDRARTWIGDRDREASTLLVVEKMSRSPAGLIILFEEGSSLQESGIEIRLGFLLAEKAWGRGYASEMIGALVRWCRGNPAISAIAGGVVKTNTASRRVLEKCGFTQAEQGTDEDLYRLAFER